MPASPSRTPSARPAASYRSQIFWQLPGEPRCSTTTRPPASSGRTDATAMNNAHANTRQHGFSLIEIMVGVVIGMIAVLVIYQVFAAAEGIKRNTTSVGDAQQNGLLSSFILGIELANASNGISYSAKELATCTPTTDPATSFRPIPVLIADGGAPDTPDSFVVNYSMSQRLVATAPFTAAAAAGASYYTPNQKKKTKTRRETQRQHELAGQVGRVAHDRRADLVPLAQRDQRSDRGDDDRRGGQRLVLLLAERDQRDQQDAGADVEDQPAGRRQPAAGAVDPTLRSAAAQPNGVPSPSVPGRGRSRAGSGSSRPARSASSRSATRAGSRAGPAGARSGEAAGACRRRCR